MNWIGKRTAGCLHLAEYPLSILEQRTWDRAKVIFPVGGRRLTVHMDSLRYHVFARSRTCVCCGLEGTRLLLDVHAFRFYAAHFNLYAEVNGRLILMTKDHIIARSNGGGDDLSNLQTMCTRCNNLKDSKQVTLTQLREIVCDHYL